MSLADLSYTTYRAQGVRPRSDVLLRRSSTCRPDRTLGGVEAVSHPLHRRRPRPHGTRPQRAALDHVGAIVADTSHPRPRRLDRPPDSISNVAGDVAVSASGKHSVLRWMDAAITYFPDFL